MPSRRLFVAVVLAVSCGTSHARAGAQTNQAAKPNQSEQKADDLAPLSYICTMAGDEAVLEDKPGICPNPKCKMALKPVRLATAYSCTVHPNQIQAGPGRCPIDKRTLVQIAASVFWTCANAPNDRFLEPGRCDNGQARVKQFERRPHGDHNPRHNGQFFMADDNWHHLEGTYERGNVFRVYFYDDFTRPIAARAFTARAVVKDPSDLELESVSMKPGRVTNTLETMINGRNLPLNVSLKVRFKPDDRERTFDFAFSDYSNQPTPPVRTTAAQPAAPAAPAPPRPENTVVDAFGVQVVLPSTKDGLLSELTKRNEEVRTLLDGGQLTAVWFPAITAKDAALALQNHQDGLNATQRAAADAAVKQLVLAAWQIDTYGDLGDKQKLRTAYDAFAGAVAAIQSAYATGR